VKAQFFSGFFKSGPGQYGEGDRFLGVTVPDVRAQAKQFAGLGLEECVALLQFPFNETRLLALLILVAQYKRGDAARRQQIYSSVMENRRRINNWNLVDSSAPYIVGPHLAGRDRTVLYDLARSAELWDRRIAVLATFAFIRNNDFGDTLALSEMLLDDPQDLMHKACGWMLREVGKRNAQVLEGFLRKHQHHMPRTMLRYAIERCPPAVRSAVMAGTF
jgi:3-methyladenine DNA glycosylase AlkD